jgi:hypothetical protein
MRIGSKNNRKTEILQGLRAGVASRAAYAENRLYGGPQM